jgi:hypothetical protein
MMLKFSYMGWAKLLARLLGGFEAAGLIHRFCAALTFTYFGLHVYDLVKQKRASGQSWRQYIAGEDGMVFNRNDWRELTGSLKWFFKRGPRPEFGRWTYWAVPGHTRRVRLFDIAPAASIQSLTVQYSA